MVSLVTRLRVLAMTWPRLQTMDGMAVDILVVVAIGRTMSGSAVLGFHTNQTLVEIKCNYNALIRK